MATLKELFEVWYQDTDEQQPLSCIYEAMPDILLDEAQIAQAWLWDWEAFEDEGSAEQARVQRIAQKMDDRVERRKTVINDVQS